MSEFLLTPMSNFPATLCISWWEQITLQWDDNDIHFVLDQHA